MSIHGSNIINTVYLESKARADKDRAASQLPPRTCLLHQRGRSALDEEQVDLQELQYYKDQMLANGWCHHQVSHLSKIHDLETFAYLATRGRSSHRLADHKQCLSHSTCVAYNTNASTYKTRHTTAECTCPTISTPYRLLTDIIRKGKIPLVSIEDTDDAAATYQLSIRPRSRTSKYIAISHVWADGLGNPNTNALPLCQMKRLRTRLISLQNILRDLEKFEVRQYPVSTICRLAIHTESTVFRVLSYSGWTRSASQQDETNGL